MTRRYISYCGRLVSTDEQGDIIIIHSEGEEYRGSTLSRFEFTSSENMDRYSSVTHISNVHNFEEYSTPIIAQKKGKRLSVSTPFLELESVGNDLAIYTLTESKVLTLVGVACQYKDALVIFLGKSNSGKTTSARFLKLHIPESRIWSDDYVCLRRTSDRIEFSVPIWDILSDCSVQTEWHSIKTIVFVDLNKDYKACSFMDLAAYVIGANFSAEINFLIYIALQELENANIRSWFLPAEYRNYYSVAKDLSGILYRQFPRVGEE